MFYIKYLAMYKVHIHTGAIRKLLNGCAYVRELDNLQASAYILTKHTLTYTYSESRERPIQTIMKVFSKSLNYLPIFFSKSTVVWKVDS